jgi:hypothetical protein
LVSSATVESIVQEMADHFDEKAYPKQFFQNLTTCLAKWDDPQLMKAADDTWSGMVDYYQHTLKNDTWPHCKEDPMNPRCY